MSTFVSVGNGREPFNRLIKGVTAVVQQLPQPVIVQHGHTPLNCSMCAGVQFVSMSEFERMIKQAELLILHAGAGSVIQAVRARKVPVVMPRRARYRECIDDHQVEFAEELAAAHRLILVEEPERIPDAVAQAHSGQRAPMWTSNNSVMLQLVMDILQERPRQHGT